MYYLNEVGIKSVLEQGHNLIDPMYFSEEYQNTLIDTLSYLEYSDFSNTRNIEITVSPRISLTGNEENIILNLHEDYTLVLTGENKKWYLNLEHLTLIWEIL